MSLLTRLIIVSAALAFVGTTAGCAASRPIVTEVAVYRQPSSSACTPQPIPITLDVCDCYPSASTCFCSVREVCACVRVRSYQRPFAPVLSPSYIGARAVVRNRHRIGSEVRRSGRKIDAEAHRAGDRIGAEAARVVARSEAQARRTTRQARDQARRSGQQVDRQAQRFGRQATRETRRTQTRVSKQVSRSGGQAKRESKRVIRRSSKEIKRAGKNLSKFFKKLF